MTKTSPHTFGNNDSVNETQSTQEAVKRRSPKNHPRGVLKAETRNIQMRKDSIKRPYYSIESAPVDRILCIDESIIETSPKQVLIGFLRDLKLPYRGLTKSKLQCNLRGYLQNKMMQCPLPATLLKRAKFWRITVSRKHIYSPLKKGAARFIVRTEWGQLGGKRFGERQTPRKIIPNPTKNRIWISNEYNTKDHAVKVARLKIRQKLNAGYYLSTEGSLSWCEAREKSTPAFVRSDNHRKLKFAGVLKMREFEHNLPVITYTHINDTPKVNFMSDNEV